MEIKKSIIFLTGAGVNARHQLINPKHYAVILAQEIYIAKSTRKWHLCLTTLIERLAILPENP